MSAPASVFHLAVRHQIWRVTLDGAFFGDYRSKSQAMEGVDEARRAMKTVGRTATVSEAVQINGG